MCNVTIEFYLPPCYNKLKAEREKTPDRYTK